MAWLIGWQYRKKITISGSTGAGMNYQVLLKVGESLGATGYDFHVNGHSSNFPSGKNQSGDLRFTADDGTTLLDFWVEKVEGTSPNRVAYIWVEVSVNLDTNQDIYCYYGNPSATNVSNGDNTFLLFDNFDGASLDPNKWTQLSSGHTLSNSEVLIADPNPTVDQLEGICTVNSFSGNFAVEVKRDRQKIAVMGTIHAPIEFYIDGNNRIRIWRYYHSLYGWYNPAITKVVAGNSTILYRDTTSHGETYNVEYVKDIKVTKIGQTFTFYWDYGSGYIQVYSGNITDWAASQAWILRHYSENNPDASYSYIDIILIRKYTSPEPAFSSAGAEEEPTFSRSFGYIFN